MKEAPFIHEKALVETDAIGEGTRIWAFAHVLKNVRIGSHCNIGDHAFIESGVTIGNNVTIKNGVCVWQHVHVGDNVFLGPNAVLTNDLTPRSRDANWIPVETWIEEGVTIGANATIDAKLSGQVDHFFWSFTVNNVLNALYYDYAIASTFVPGRFSAYPLPGRSYLLKAGATF